jgi:hypothetical protein
MILMQPLPIPCPAALIPDATGQDAFNAVYRAAIEQRAVFIAVELQGQRWTVKADALTAPQHDIDAAVYDTVREAVIRLIRSRQIRFDSSAGPVYFVLYDVGGESRARELAAALHAPCTATSTPWPVRYRCFRDGRFVSRPRAWDSPETRLWAEVRAGPGPVRGAEVDHGGAVGDDVAAVAAGVAGQGEGEPWFGCGAAAGRGQVVQQVRGG